MEHVNELAGILQLFFLWNKARCMCCAQIIIALFSSRTVNLSILAEAFVSGSKKESNYRRITRFISWMPTTMTVKFKLGEVLLYILGIRNKKIHLSMDRTCWDFGSRSINFLVIGVYYQGMSIPIFFKLLPKYTKKGNSNTPQRIRLLKKAVSLVGAKNIICFAADREFIGGEWFAYLQSNKINFVIRMKENTLVTRPGSSHKTSAKEVCKRIKKGKRKVFKGLFNIWGINLYLAAARNDAGELMVLASNVNDKRLFKYYLKRWSIETLFKYLKTHGFNLEDTRLTKSCSLESLFFILALAVTWTIVVSRSLRKKAPLKRASHGRWRVSFFKRGLSAIRRSISNLLLFPEDWIGFCSLLISKTHLEVILRGPKKKKKRNILFTLCCGGA